jgi:hypothetical protein
VELNAAYGAYGFGLCPSYTDPYKCEEEEAAFGEEDMVPQLDYTSKTLSATHNGSQPHDQHLQGRSSSTGSSEGMRLFNGRRRVDTRMQ